MDPTLTIKQAHVTAVSLRKLIESSLPGIAEVDVDLELDEGDPMEDDVVPALKDSFSNGINTTTTSANESGSGESVSRSQNSHVQANLQKKYSIFSESSRR
jgi:hypothetical protein